MVRISKLPENFRTALAMHDDGSGNIKHDVLVDALKSFVEMSQHKIPIFALDKKIQPELEKLDKDKNGYLTIQEVNGLGWKLAKQRKRQIDFFGVIVVGFILILSLSAVMGLSYLALDLNKDVRVFRGMLTNREDGTPIKVFSSVYSIQDNVMHPGGGEIEFPENNSFSVKTSIQEFRFNEISGNWPNDALAAVTMLSVMPKPLSSHDHGPFIHTHVDFIVRLPNRAGINGGNVVLMNTPAGRFVIRESSLQPATGELATLDGPALHMEAVRLPSRRNFAVASGRRQTTQTCTSLNRCSHNRRQSTSEVDCCDGQASPVLSPGSFSFLSNTTTIYKCTTTDPPYSCPRGMFCSSPSSSAWCRDREVVEIATNSYGCSGVYTLQYNEVWDGPAFVGPNCAYIVSGSTWYLVNKTDYDALAFQSPIILGTGSDDPFNVLVNGVHAYVTVVLSNAEKGIYCPGNAQISPGLWYAPPFLRKCAPGFYCHMPNYQFPCKNLALTVKFGYSATYAGTYYLSPKTYNGHPIYNSFKYQSCSYSCNYLCSYTCSMVDYSCSQQNCSGAPLFAGLVYSTIYDPFNAIGGVYSIIPAAFISKVTTGQVAAIFVAGATRNPPSWSQSNGPTEDWVEFSGAWSGRTLADVVCPGGSKLPTTGVYTP